MPADVTSRPIRYAESAPPDGLDDIVRDLWGFEASPDVEPGVFTLPPDACLSLAVVAMGSRLGVRVVGPHLRPLDVPVGPGSRVAGVRFRPEAAGPALGLDMPAWRDRNEAADADLPDLAEALSQQRTVDAGRSALLDAIARRARRSPPPDALARRAVEAIEAARGGVQVTALAADLGVSLRTLQRRFRTATGLPPKPYARTRRFLLAAANVMREAPEAWGRVAAEHGFADQAHFARECVALTGLSPTAFADQMATVLHVDVRP